MALPDPEQLAYRGITSGNARCMAYRGYICDLIIAGSGWRDAIRLTVFLKRKLLMKVEF